jgi:hypothetical protein
MVRCRSSIKIREELEGDNNQQEPERIEDSYDPQNYPRCPWKFKAVGFHLSSHVSRIVRSYRAAKLDFASAGGLLFSFL